MKSTRSLIAAASARQMKLHKQRIADWQAKGIPEGYTLEDFENELARSRDALHEAYGFRPGFKTEMTPGERENRWEQVRKDMENLRAELDRLEYEAGLEYLARQLQHFDPRTPKEFGKSYWEDLKKRVEFYRRSGLVVGFQWEHVRNEVRDRGREALAQQHLNRHGQPG